MKVLKTTLAVLTAAAALG
ncbi:amino acid ABC transporter substrate-binding protein, partial [Pseudomonas sp. TJI-51]